MKEKQENVDCKKSIEAICGMPLESFKKENQIKENHLQNLTEFVWTKCLYFTNIPDIITPCP